MKLPDTRMCTWKCILFLFQQRSSSKRRSLKWREIRGMTCCGPMMHRVLKMAVDRFDLEYHCDDDGGVKLFFNIKKYLNYMKTLPLIAALNVSL